MTPPAAVVGVLHDRGRFLLIQRASTVPAAGWWAPPSGSVEPGETSAAAVAREMNEELGLTVEAIRHVWTCASHDGRFTLQWWLVATKSYTVTPDPREVAAVAWCTTEEIAELSPTFDDDVRFFVDIWPTLGLDEPPVSER
jgi:8-oxo-dGTP diphosphatase